MLKTIQFNKNYNKTFMLYFISFFSVIIVPILIVGIFSHYISTKTLREEISNSSINSLSQVQTALERTLDEIDKLTVRTSLDGRIISYSNNQSNFMMNEVLDLSRELSSKNENIISVKFYFDSNSTIISSSGILSSFYEPNSFLWMDEARNRGNKALWLPTKRVPNYDGGIDSIITLVRQMPVGSTQKLGFITVNINESKIYSILENMKNNTHSIIYITDSNGSLLSGKNSELYGNSLAADNHLRKIIESGSIGYFIQDIGKKPTLVCYSKSNYNGWIYVSETPLTYVNQKLSYIGNLTLIICSILALAGLVISFQLSRTMYNPVQKLIDLFKANSSDNELNNPNNDSFAFLSSSLQQVINQKTDLEKSFNSSLPVLKERFVLNILSNRLSDNTEIQDQLDFLKLDMSSSQYSVILVELDNYADFVDKLSISDINMYKFAIRNVTEELINQRYKCLSAEVSENRIAFIVNIFPEHQEDFKKDILVLLEKAKDAVCNYFNLTITAGVGSVCNELNNIHLSYKESLNVIKYKLLSGADSILFYDELSESCKVGYSYPDKTEAMILNNIKAGNIQNVFKYLSDIYGNIRLNYSHTNDEVYRIYSRLLDATANMLNDSGIKYEDIFEADFLVYKELAKKETLNDIHSFIKSIMETIALHISNMNKGDKNMEKVLQFISKSYQKDISVEQIADHIGLNTSYFCRVFKAFTGKTVVEYITLLRMEESKKLLKDSNLSINQIAQSVGYNNVHSYMRFFKKHEGITPGEYRKSAG